MLLNSPRARHQNFTIKITNQQENKDTFSQKVKQPKQAEIRRKTIIFYAGINEF